jgi:hypothetical protein
VVVVEVAHEALLRQWPTLTAWLDEDVHALKILDAVQRAAAEWTKNREEANSGEAWLVHTGERLVAAEAVRRRSDFERLLGPDGQAYLEACRARDERVRQEKEELAEREALAERKRLEAEAKTARRTRIAAYVIAFVAAIAVGAAFFGWRQAIVAKKERNQALASVSREQMIKGSYSRNASGPQASKQIGKDRQLRRALRQLCFTPYSAQRGNTSCLVTRKGSTKYDFRQRHARRNSLARPIRAFRTRDGETDGYAAGPRQPSLSAEFSPDGKRW